MVSIACSTGIARGPDRAHAAAARGWRGALADEVAALVAAHERVGDTPASRAINDADALSFFAFNSPGYLAYFGAAQTAAKIAYTLACMSPRARRALHTPSSDGRGDLAVEP